MTAYYNEIDPYCCQWLRNLIDAGHIAPGVVDGRSIEDIVPDELREYTQCHFFAGIGVWSYALRLAGWPDDRPVWTGSCPCQPFSSAGKGAGFADERHLWPAWFHLIRECRPRVVFGEQVESAIAHGWLDLVQDDLEAEGYAFAPVGIPAASVGAPGIRQRLWFVADSNGEPSWRNRGAILGAQGEAQRPLRNCADGLGNGREASELADADSVGRASRGEGCAAVGYGTTTRADRGARALVNTDDARLEGRQFHGERAGELTAGPTGLGGFWSDAEWIACRDGKSRPVEPGTFPLAHGAPGRVGRLRAYGNAIVPQVAAAFIKASMT